MISLASFFAKKVAKFATWFVYRTYGRELYFSGAGTAPSDSTQQSLGRLLVIPRARQPAKHCADMRRNLRRLSPYSNHIASLRVGLISSQPDPAENGSILGKFVCQQCARKETGGGAEAWSDHHPGERPLVGACLPRSRPGNPVGAATSIAPSWVLTAAHSSFYPPSSSHVLRAGN
jgi:hypothetical protein